MSFAKTINLGNSIIGVSILSMPYCFVQSGLLLSVLLILLSGFLTRLSCHFLLKSAQVLRRRSFELMVQDVLGSAGRITVELGLIGFLLGTCVAYFIMIGDLAPKIVAELLDINYSYLLRVVCVLLLASLIAFPLSLFKQVESLTSFSLLSMILYSCLILKLINEATYKLASLNNPTNAADDEQLDKVSYWNFAGLLSTFPIFSMAMSCQTSLFEIFDGSQTNNEPPVDTVRRDNATIKQAVYMCSFMYITVGLLGYIAFHEQISSGNILLAFPPSLTTTLTKIGFIVTLLMSFPLCLFPCRTSVHSLTIGNLRRSPHFQALPTSAAASCDAIVNISELDDRGYASAIATAKHCDNDKNNNNHHHTSNHPQQTSLQAPANKWSANYPLHEYPLGGVKKANFSSLLGGDDDEYLDNNNGGFEGSHQGTTGDDTGYRFDFDKSNSLKTVGVQSGSMTDSTANGHYGQTSSKLYMSDLQFRLLTILLITLTVILSLMFPHIELILSLIGSTAGTVVCFVLPAFTFIQIGQHSHTELYLARLLLLIGFAMLLFCTYSTIHDANFSSTWSV